jgi:hypothetical protein
MGGAAAIAAQADAEEALRTRCDQRGVSCTVLRLGALVDTAQAASRFPLVAPMHS